MESAGKLETSIEALRGRLFTIEEFPFIDRERFPSGILETALQINSDDISCFAAKLKGHQIEALLLDYRSIQSVVDQERLIAILLSRFSNRLFKLIMAIYQYDYESGAMNRLCQAANKSAEERNQYPNSGLFLWKFPVTSDRFEKIAQFIDDNGKSLDAFFMDFHINESSLLAEMINYHYLKSCDHDALSQNSRHLLHIIQNMGPSQILDPVTNYLGRFSFEDYMDGINLAILDKLGEPYISPEWNGYTLILRDRFAQWKFSYQLRLRTRNYPRKYEILSKYYDKVRSSEEIEDGRLMIIDFGEIVVVDILDKPYSLFYYKRDFEREMTAWQDMEPGKEPTFLGIDKVSVTARDYIIEDKEEGCMQLSYEGVGILYIQELLDIKMGLEPDVRNLKKK